MITFMPKTTISVEEWEQIEAKSKAAKLILEEKRFSFLIDYLKSAKADIERIILNNTVREVREEVTITDQLKRIFVTPRKQQLDELAGQYKLLEQLFNFLHQTVNLKEEAERLEDKHKLVIERSRER